MNTENSDQLNISANEMQKDAQAKVEESIQYKRVLPTEDAQENALPVDFRRVQHGHGPCACCGPYSE